MRWVSTTIKRKYLEKILSGEKKIERKVASEYWNKRLNKVLKVTPREKRGEIEDIGLSLLCGRECHKFEVTHLFKKHSDGWTMIDGIATHDWWEIHIGDRIE